MNNEVKTKWLAALRSGEYPQCKGALHDANGGFCCLGVLCDLYDQEHKVLWTKTDGDYKYMGELALLPEVVANWAELPCSDPVVDDPDPEEAETAATLNLSEMNDTGWSFKEIANAIEKSL